MKNNETVVLAAVQENAGPLQLAGADMKNEETVVLAAVQQDGYALELSLIHI